MPKVFRIICSSVFAATVAGAVFVSDARATECTESDCLTGVSKLLRDIRAESKLSGGGTLDPVVETTTLDTRFVGRMSFLLNGRDLTTKGVRTATRRTNSFIERDREVASISTSSTRLSRLFGRLDRNRFNPQVFIKTPEESIYSENMIETRNPPVAAVPLPATLPLILAGLGALAVVRRRRRTA